MSKGAQMWGGRFQGGLDPYFAEFQKSLVVDHALAFADLENNLSWSAALTATGIFTEAEFDRVRVAIEAIAEQWTERGVPKDDPAEDVHSLVEREIVARCGELGKRIHTGRSRNDQVATDLRMHLREQVLALAAGIHAVCDALVQKAEAHFADPMPGYTHLQRAQPITIGHHALAHAEPLARDRERLLDCLMRLDICPLGSGALAGTTVPVDREALAEQLGFHGALRNSMDATSARDHLCELLFVCAMTMTHLSRLAEDYVFFSSYECGFVRFGDAVATGSSLMPQKRNPDAMELVRGKCARVHGALLAMLGTVKGLPMAYNRDLQTDKETLFPALAETIACLRVAALAVTHATFDVARCRREAERGYLNATDLADLLVEAGVAFRDAHEIVGKAVDRAIELGVELQDLPTAERKRLLPQLGADFGERLTVDAVLARRRMLGGTAPQCVAAEARRWREQLAVWEHEFADGCDDPGCEHHGSHDAEEES